MKPYLQHIFRLVWRQKKKFLILVVLSLLDVAVRLVQPYLYKVVVDTLTEGLVASEFTEAAVQFLLIVIAIWLVVSILNNLFYSFRQYLGWDIGTQSSQWVHMEGYRKLLRMDYHKHTQKHSSQYAKIVDDADTATWEITNWWINRIFPALVGFTGMLVIAFSVSWQMTLISLSVVPPGLFVIFYMMMKYKKEQYRVNRLWTKKHEHLSDQIANIITYKLNQNEMRFMNVQKGYSDRASNAQMKISKKWRTTMILNPDVIARFLVMAFGVFMVKDGLITLGTLFMFMGLMNEILQPLHLLGDILPQYNRRARHLDKYLKLLAEEDMVKDPKRARKIKAVKGRIEFKNVSFVYPDTKNREATIKNLSFTIEPGQHVALVGHSGCGKTTIVSLLTRLVDPTEGQILLDGVDIRKYKQVDYRKHIGTVLQEHSLYNETVAQNIAYGKANASRAQIIAAATTAQAHGYIKKLPDRYDTKIGERGVRLSGGEKQRLAIARAILKDPQIVVLDEPTSALDSITEAKVQKGLIKLIEGSTSVTVAHRLSTVRNSDKILVIEEGKLVAKGSHMELLRSCKDYRDMVDLQTGGFLAE
jgi:ABC-type multidrug transport system fused ATPase/permease subunit